MTSTKTLCPHKVIEVLGFDTDLFWGPFLQPTTGTRDLTEGNDKWRAASLGS